MFNRCDALKAQLDACRPLPAYPKRFPDFWALSETAKIQSFNTVLSLLR